MTAIRSRLRLHFVTEDDPLYVIRFFETFFAELPDDEFEVIGITIQPAFNESLAATARRVLSLYGAVGFARLLSRVVRSRLARRSIAALAKSRAVPFVPTASVNDPAFVERIRAAAPDVVVSVAAPEIFRGGILDAPRLGCINVHSGRLPAYRGMLPTFWQMSAGESHATVTVHEMTRRLDAGAVLGTSICPIRARDSLDRVIVETKREAARLTLRVLRELAAGTVAPQPLEMAQAAYFSFPTRSDARRFRKLGHRVL